MAEAKVLAEAIVRALDSQRAQKIEMIQVSDVTILADYFILCTATSTTQIRTLSDLCEEAGEQLDLFTPQAAVRRGKQEKLERTMDALRDRYGPHVIGYASRQTQTAREIAGDETGKRKEESP